MSRATVEYVIGKQATHSLWTNNFLPVFPFTPQNFYLGAVLPAVLYMMRWGHRRGKGRFAEVFGKDASVADITNKLVENTDAFHYFKSNEQRAILGDMLLAYCLENEKHLPGRDIEVMRAFATHYFSSWFDKPDSQGHLRGIPEFIVSILAQQEKGDRLKIGQGQGYFKIASNMQDNLLLRILGAGTEIPEDGKLRDDLRSDTFNEDCPVGIDQLLTIRIAQHLGEAPQRARGRGESPEILNQLPAAYHMAMVFHEDLNVFLRAYGEALPRQTLLPMLESCLAMGLTTILLGTLPLMDAWEREGSLPDRASQQPYPIFLDCSTGIDYDLRRLAEETFDDFYQHLSHLPEWLMSLRILELEARDVDITLPNAAPNPISRLNSLGDIYFGRHEESSSIARDVNKICNRLADEFEDAGEDEVVALLRSNQVNPIRRLAEALVFLMRDSNQINQFRKCLDSFTMVNEPHGLTQKRKSTVRGRQNERRSFVLTNTMLDYLVHRHKISANRRLSDKVLSLEDFISILQERYGICIDQMPSGRSAPVDLLQRNRHFLERRLRDLGLLIGVNDAESMKRLRARYEVTEDDFVSVAH